MKTKVLLIAAASLLSIAAVLHTAHQPPADEKCPLATAISAGK